MKRKQYMLLLLAALTVTVPTILGFRHGVRLAERQIQEQPDSFPNPEHRRAMAASHGATGGFLLGSFIVVYFVVANALIRGFGVVFDGTCAGVGWMARKRIDTYFK
jgi:hypothetical protein